MNLAEKGTIISVRHIAKRTVEVAIEVSEEFHFIAGQYIWLMIPQLNYPDSRGNTRMFSVASSPNKKGEVDILFRIGESGYKKTLTEMPPGATVLFSGPFGQLKLPEDVSMPVVLIAGGVGVAPFASMIRFAHEIRSSHRIMLISVNARAEEAVYLDEFAQIERGHSGFKLSSIFGSLRERALKRSINGFIGQKTFWSVIGSQEFVDAVSAYLYRRGVPLRDILFEQYYPTNIPVHD